MKRIFIAVKADAGPGLQETLATFKTVLEGERIKWTDPGNMHLTIAFLGDTGEKRVGPLSLMLKERCQGFGEFGFMLKGTGLFRSFRDPKVIWIGIESSDRLLRINELITAGLKETGFLVGERIFRPHLTLGRVKSLKDTYNLKTLIEQYAEKEIQKVEVREVILYESILMPTGPLYKALGKFSL